ncbi:hypothetical protein APS56_07635 [Pseudalgibacter alginicilyticus]|uniref:DUF4129 domain-containing protein n=1 Tax=Pseudalgibacter alginicilyticus TaxID=1736674 RepID=A0A0P0CWV5_9FLAO|nr:hypothetical protein [Pseudalgibacter alginicilyticus]ALJ05002.1 hypothetical protein APS56_07635 [Pseudalgibacter alginicilyticus]
MLKKSLLILSLFSYFCFQSGIVLAQQPTNSNLFDDDFKKRYTGRKYNYEGKEVIGYTPEGKGEIADYKNEKNRIKEKNNENQLSINLGPLGWIFILILLVAIAYFIFILLNEGSGGWFSKRQQQKLNNNSDITSKNIENTDIQLLINHAENNHNYRMAIRYYYLLVLKTLSLKNHIKIEDDKTNADYLNEINTSPFFKKFNYISYIYNYTWYGEFEVNTAQYNVAKSNFTNLINSIK